MIFHHMISCCFEYCHLHAVVYERILSISQHHLTLTQRHKAQTNRQMFRLKLPPLNAHAKGFN